MALAKRGQIYSRYQEEVIYCDGGEGLVQLLREAVGATFLEVFTAKLDRALGSVKCLQPYEEGWN